MTDQSDRYVVLGHISRPHGVHGAFIISPYTDDPGLILKGQHLELRSPDGRTRRPLGSLKGKEAAQGLIVKVADISTREAAGEFKGWSLVMAREHLPEPAEEEVYWADLLGLSVQTPDGRSLGRVEHLMEAGAGLILVVADPESKGRELLLPFQEEFLVELDLENGQVIIDPPPGLLDL
jgi:16S rRNA processing protein RimM